MTKPRGGLAAVLATLLLVVALASSASAQNAGGTVFASAASTSASRNSADFVNLAGKCGALTVDITARTSGTITATLQAKDGTSGKYSTVLASSGLNSTGTTQLKVCPGMTAASNAVVNDMWPMVWRVAIAGTATPVSMTYSVGYWIVE